jgi:hypothetical protein
LFAESGHVFDQLVQLGFELLEFILFGLQLLLGLRFRRLTLVRPLCGRGEVRLRALEPLLKSPCCFGSGFGSALTASLKEVKEATLAASVF